MATNITLKNSINTSAPTTLGVGELAICTLINNEKIYLKNSAGTIININDWSKLTNKPTTLSGYGITDSANVTVTNSLSSAISSETASRITNDNSLSSAISIINSTDYSLFKGNNLTDKLTLSAEMLNINGWNSIGWTGNYTTNFGHDEGNTNSLTNTIAAISSNKYVISIATIDGGDGYITVNFGGVSKIVNGDDAVSFGVLAINTNNLIITPSVDFIGTIYQLSLKLITSVISPIMTYYDRNNNITNEVRTLTGDSIYFGKNSGKYSFATKNTGVGNGALYSVMDGGINTAVGNNSLYNLTNGWMNTAVGQSAGMYNMYGINNIYLGYSAGNLTNAGQLLKNTTNSIYIGTSTKALSNDVINEIVIGSYAVGNGSNSTTIGTSATTLTKIYGNLVTTGEITAYYSSDKNLKKNINKIDDALSIINKLNPVKYNWNDEAIKLNNNKDSLQNNYGLIAQELEEILPELIHPIYNDKYKSIDYIQIIPFLIQSIKEQQIQINELKNNNK